MDLTLASLLLGEPVGGRYDVVPNQAVEWVKEKLKA
jgi:hypothetical protein